MIILHSIYKFYKYVAGHLDQEYLSRYTGNRGSAIHIRAVAIALSGFADKVMSPKGF